LVAFALASSGSPALPPTSTSPRDVLNAYLNALVARDCWTARALATEDYADVAGNLCGSGHVRARGNNLDRTPTLRAGEAEFMTTLTLAGTDTGNDGTFDWFYSLRHEPSGAWRVVGGGTGP
jgi:hypothetical protein